ncbi:dicer-like protein 2 [Nemania sp. NC0429]|nr:dicer-like protein 2 [Nemania sp. NC0429]
MHSPTSGFAMPVSEHDSSSSDEDSSPLEEDPIPEQLPDHDPEFHDGAAVTPTGLESLAQESSVVDPVEDAVVIHARGYQVEMFEKSLQQNIIVAMDTGSGKTQVAVLRIQAELEKHPDKIIWFLTPTIALCEQQFRVIKSQIGAAQIKILSGADDVDTWSETRIWNDYLRDTRVVVSTFQVLLDAITHAFVRFSQLCLIVFDEAHNCVRNHPGSKIMQRYRLHKENGMQCPAILGLTASPIMRSSLDGIEEIEQTLDAVCKTPTIHREELLSAVNLPTLSSVIVPDSGDRRPINSMVNLANATRNLNIYEDPYVLRLQRERTERSIYNLRKTLAKRDTRTIKQMQSFYRKSAEIHRQLGPWGSEYFIYQSVTQFLEENNQDLAWTESWTMEERRYLSTILRQVEVTFPQPLKDTTRLELSEKYLNLVHELKSAPDNTRCIIFVLETATVAVLSQMLSSTPAVNSCFQVGTMIGTSNHSARRRNLGELNQAKDTRDLEDFRIGKLNLLIATSVAEEGIDVPACNLVICFDEPPNLKSFIQRRGRARMGNSRIVLFSDGSSDQHDTWMMLEDLMKKTYEDDTRVARELAELEELDTDLDMAPLCIPSTGARLEFDQARSHLDHLCRKLTSKQYIDHSPYYIPERIDGFSDGLPRISATVHLPPSLPPDIRRVKSHKFWYSEKNAFNDAAFQAFKAVYKAGLVNDNLMPLVDDILANVEKRSSIMEVNEVWKPWRQVAQLWGEPHERVQRELLLKDGERVLARFEASLPCHFPRLSSFKIYWDADTTWTVETSERSTLIAASVLKEDQSAALIDLAYGHRWSVEDSAYILHLRCTEDIQFGQHVGQRVAEKGALSPDFLVRNNGRKPHLFIDWLASKPPPELVKTIDKEAWDEREDVPWLALRGWPRRQDLLHPVSGHLSPSRPDERFPRALPVSHCTLDTIDRSKVYFGSVIPAITHMLEIHLTAEELCRTVLEGVNFSDISPVLTAISSRAAGEATDYEELEFLGDSVLKILATLSVMIQHPNYPEGYLSAMKDRIVSNSRLCRASVDRGLDRFILTKSFTGVKWRPLYVKDLISREIPPPARRKMSTKTLADVVESLVGAAFDDRDRSTSWDVTKALTCLRIFLPDVEWYDLGRAHEILFDRREVTKQLRPEFEPLEQLLGYRFHNKAWLMESLTHTSWGFGTHEDACMERLEFLGDSILDGIVVLEFWGQKTKLTNDKMHLLRTACVNADLLGFLVMEWCTTQQVTEISPISLATTVTQKLVPFWKYMRHRSSDVARLQRAAEERHIAERESIRDVMLHGAEYPWAQLAHLNIPKFFSDMFESVIGAVWVDSGSMDACKEIVERIGILPYLRRILSDNVNVKHPKNSLGEMVARDNKRVRYETDVRIENGVKDLFCKVFVGERFILEVSGGVNPEEVVTKAADEAYHHLLNDDEDEIMTE